MSSFDRDRLPKAFREAGLGLKVLGGPIEPRNRRIFQMDILQSETFGEYFRIWPGARDNQIEVVSCAPPIRQLVLRVKEARRPYHHRIKKWPDHRRSSSLQTRNEGVPASNRTGVKASEAFGC